MLHYAKMERSAEATFAVFSILFFTMRLIVFPLWMLRAVTFDLPHHLGVWPAYIFCLTLLYLLQVLNIYWFKLIVIMACQLIKGQRMKKDARSESNISSDDYATTQTLKQRRKRQ